MDTLTPAQRHKNMSRIRSSETTPEKQIRSALFKMGFRFRKNDKRLSGKPDIVLPHYRAVVFVNGCFGHGHEGCPKYVVPKSNTEFWLEKIRRNRERDKNQREKLLEEGWRVGVVWECSIRGKGRAEKIKDVAGQICYWLEEEPYEFLKHFK